MDNLENTSAQPEFDPIAESADFLPDDLAEEEILVEDEEYPEDIEVESRKRGRAENSSL